jgi:hypothetical protein
VKTPSDWTREYRDFLAVFEEVNAELLRIPGVIRVSVGVKEQGGGLTERMAFRVYVRAKLPEDAIPPEHIVPRTIRGYATDVVVELPRVNIAGFNDENDDRNYETKVGGIRIGNDKGLQAGTLGCFATRNSDSQLVLLSNYHVLLSDYPTTLARADIPGQKIAIGQPRYESCCCCGCNGIGVVADGVYGALDCAIAEVNESVPYYDRIKRILRNDGSIEQEGMFLGSDTPVPGRKVWKIGARTGLTRGTIVDVPNDILVANDPPFSLFVDHGDSGSALVDADSMKIVGLLKSAERNAGVMTGRAFATPIGLVVAALGIQINGSDELWWTEVARRQADISLQPDSPFAPVAARLRASPVGAQALELVEAHRSEVLALVNRSRRGKVAWQRLQGPSFVAAYARSAREPAYQVPTAINGMSRQRALARMHSLLRDLGSEELRRDLARYDTALVDLLLRHDSVGALLDAVEGAGLAAGSA